MNNPFCTYHDNGNYADLSNYGRPELIMTKYAVLLDCTQFLIKFMRYDSLAEMFKYCKVVTNESIAVEPIEELSYISKRVKPAYIYANFYKAPWSIVKGTTDVPEDIEYYQLCTEKKLPKFKSFYYGTNYGTVWNSLFGRYNEGAVIGTKNYAGVPYREFKLQTDNEDEPDIRVRAQYISAHFIPNTDSTKPILVHKDGDANNNHVSNLYWSDGEPIKEVEEDTKELPPNILPKDLVSEMLATINHLYKNKGILKTKIYDQLAKNHNVSVYCIQNSIKYHFGNDAVTPTHTTNVVKHSTTKIPYNTVEFTNDYSINGDYAVARTFGRPDIIVCNNGRIYCIDKESADKYFPTNNYNKWPNKSDIPSIATEILYQRSKNDKSMSITSPYHTDTKTIKYDLVYDIYFNSPWYMRYIGADIQYAKFNTHSEFSTFADHYFMCSNGLLYSVKSARYLSPKHRGSYTTASYSLEDIYEHGYTRSVAVLLGCFEFEVLNEHILRYLINKDASSSTFK